MAQGYKQFQKNRAVLASTQESGTHSAQGLESEVTQGWLHGKVKLSAKFYTWQGLAAKHRKFSPTVLWKAGKKETLHLKHDRV